MERTRMSLRARKMNELLELVSEGKQRKGRSEEEGKEGRREGGKERRREDEKRLAALAPSVCTPVCTVCVTRARSTHTH
jgi:hypothetical protein